MASTDFDSTDTHREELLQTIPTLDERPTPEAFHSWLVAMKDAPPNFKIGEEHIYIATTDVEYETAKVHQLDLSSWNLKPIHELVEDVFRKHSSDCIPGVPYWKWLDKNPNLVPEELKDGKIYFLFGSLMGDGNGFWGIPCIHFKDGRFHGKVWPLKEGWAGWGAFVLKK